MTQMTRQHFNAIADCIAMNFFRPATSDTESAYNRGNASAALWLSYALRKFNPAFDRERFMVACKVEV